MLDIDRQMCFQCAGCIGVCPEMALYMNLDGLNIRHDLCTTCGICVEFCPVLALDFEGRETTAASGQL
jgi:NAD-dependent dihydropyrimidine dehydrogenase PreA subunit